MIHTVTVVEYPWKMFMRCSDKVIYHICMYWQPWELETPLVLMPLFSYIYTYLVSSFCFIFRQLGNKLKNMIIVLSKN